MMTWETVDWLKVKKSLEEMDERPEAKALREQAKQENPARFRDFERAYVPAVVL